MRLQFVSVALVAAGALACSCSQFVPGQSVTQKVSQQYDVSAPPSIVINDAAGSIQVTAGDASKVTIDAEKSAANNSDLNQMNVSFSNENGEVRAEFKSEGSNGGRSVAFKVTAPAGSRLQLQSANGSVQADGFTNSVSANSGNASITLKNLGGAVDAKAGNGSITLDGRLSGASTATTGNGSITVTLPRDSNLRVSASASNGSITNGFGLQVQGSDNRRADGQIGDGSGGSLTLQAGNGSITINPR